MHCGFLAEKEGFEPSLRSSRTTPLAGEPLRPLGYFSMPKDELILLHQALRTCFGAFPKSWRREWDSNPRMLSHRRFSRPVPSTTRTSLRFGRFGIITYYSNCVNWFRGSVSICGISFYCSKIWLFALNC